MKTNRNFLIFILMLILVPLAGEPKIHPFSGDLSLFRVSFGSPVFLLFLLWIRNTSFILSGVCVGFSVSCFRILLDLTFYGMDFDASLLLRAPVFFYYFIYAACFQIPKAATLYSKALQIAGWSILAEFVASIAELSVTAYMLNDAFSITWNMAGKIILIAIIRCFFILSFFYLSQLYQAEVRANHESSQKQHMLLLISNLYEEVVQLNKSQQNAEQVTRNCYQLYEKLQNSTEPPDTEQLASQLLGIAGEVHDIKKDNQRIYAGLCQLTDHRCLDTELPARELGKIIVQSNQKYALSLDKDIAFYSAVDSTLPPLHVYTVLSLVNNLVANAVEAIVNTGDIRISFARVRGQIEVQVSNTGKTIPQSKLNLIFKPGYTTKFDRDGNPSSGVGLPYVKHLTESLGGQITVDILQKNRITFTLTLPLQNLKG